MADRKIARISTYGGRGDTVWDATPGLGWIKADTVQHWQLIFGNTFIADTSSPETAVVFHEIAARLNGHKADSQRSS